MFVQMLGANATLTGTLQGRIYKGKRSDGKPTEECIVVNTPWVNHRRPQEGYTNINIHVPDEVHTIDGMQQTMPGERMKILTTIVLAILDEYNSYGFSVATVQENAMAESTRAEHYNNLRIDWIYCN